MPEKLRQISSTQALREDAERAARAPHVVLFIEETGGQWHTDALRVALEGFGARVTETTLTACAFDSGCKTGLYIPGFADTLPDGAFVRSISTGTLEQITFRLGILHALTASGVRVWNEARAVERCVDKSTATFLLQQQGLPVPVTHTCERPDLAQRFLAGMSPVVSKPLFGSQGNGVTKRSADDGLPDATTVGGVYYQQQFVPPSANHGVHRFADWRVLVSGGRALAAMARRGDTWITNLYQGATPEAARITPDLANIAVGAARALGADYAGVDLIKEPDGRLLVLEVNSNPAWKGLQSVTGVDIGTELARDFLTAVAQNRSKGESPIAPEPRGFTSHSISEPRSRLSSGAS